uniref:Uncharacterized protein n=1 Tax=Romanomermis culicivorax TaxID=13658 RepID=A0A915HRA4_ROMCU
MGQKTEKIGSLDGKSPGAETTVATEETIHAIQALVNEDSVGMLKFELACKILTLGANWPVE